MNKRGYLRTLEAVIAVLIIFGFILFIFPRTERFEGHVPVELERIADAMLDEIENNDRFRKCVLSDSVQSEDVIMVIGYECVNEFISESMPPFSPWNYAFEICNFEENRLVGCIFFDPRKDPCLVGELNLPEDKSVFTRSLFVSVDDVSALPLESPAEGSLVEYKRFRIYFWEK